MSKSLKESAQNFAINRALNYVEGNPEENLPKLLDMIDTVFPKEWYGEQREAIKKEIERKGNWYQFILKLYELDPGVRKVFFQNFLFNASLKGSAIIEESREREKCNILWESQRRLLH